MGKDDLTHLSSGWGLCTRPGYDVCYCAIFRGVNGYEKELFINYKPTNFGMEGR